MTTTQNMTPIHDLDKTAQELLSDSAFQSLEFVNAEIAKIEARQQELRTEGAALKFGSTEERINYTFQREADGRRWALAIVQGHLEAVTLCKRIIAEAKEKHALSLDFPSR